MAWHIAARKTVSGGTVTKLRSAGRRWRLTLAGKWRLRVTSDYAKRWGGALTATEFQCNSLTSGDIAIQASGFARAEVSIRNSMGAV
jgi:hypothetical protein